MPEKFSRILPPLLAAVALLALGTAVLTAGLLAIVPDPDPGATFTLTGAGIETASAGAIRVIPLANTAPAPRSNPRMVFRDDDVVWTQDTLVEIFHGEYDEDRAELTVKSADGDKVIAPGTGDTYQFYIENKGNVSLDYAMAVEASAVCTVGEESYVIPLEAKLSSIRGPYLLGSADQWAPFDGLDGITDSGVVASRYYQKYTLEWQWPFEQPDLASGDAYDTMLGNLAAEGNDLRAYVIIRLVAQCDEDPKAPGGLPKTGDESRIGLWLAVCVVSLVLLVVLLASREKFTGDPEQKRK